MCFYFSRYKRKSTRGDVFGKRNALRGIGWVCRSVNKATNIALNSIIFHSERAKCEQGYFYTSPVTAKAKAVIQQHAPWP